MATIAMSYGNPVYDVPADTLYDSQELHLKLEPAMKDYG